MYLVLNRHRVCPPRLITCPVYLLNFLEGVAVEVVGMYPGGIYSPVSSCAASGALYTRRM